VAFCVAEPGCLAINRAKCRQSNGYFTDERYSFRGSSVHVAIMMAVTQNEPLYLFCPESFPFTSQPKPHSLIELVLLPGAALIGWAAGRYKANPHDREAENI